MVASADVKTIRTNSTISATNRYFCYSLSIQSVMTFDLWWGEAGEGNFDTVQMKVIFYLYFLQCTYERPV